MSALPVFEQIIEEPNALSQSQLAGSAIALTADRIAQVLNDAMSIAPELGPGAVIETGSASARSSLAASRFWVRPY